MIYGNSLKALRARLVEQATGTPVEQENQLESFIPSRKTETQAAPATEDILDRAANWLKEIRQASSEAEKRFSQTSLRPKKNPATAFAESMASGLKEVSAEERKQAFIERRSKDSPSTYAPRRPSETPVPLDAEISSVLDAIAAVESRGSGDYAAIGPLVEKGMYAGQRAYGKYQVMEGNIGPWTEEALGERLSVEEFMNDPSAQDAVAAHQLSKAKDKYGTWEDAASVWFSGRPMAQAGNASDGLTTVPEYINKFRRNFVRA